MRFLKQSKMEKYNQQKSNFLLSFCGVYFVTNSLNYLRLLFLNIKHYIWFTKLVNQLYY